MVLTHPETDAWLGRPPQAAAPPPRYDAAPSPPVAQAVATVAAVNVYPDVAVAAPYYQQQQSPAPPPAAFDEGGCRQYLRHHGWPSGLQAALVASLHKVGQTPPSPSLSLVVHSNTHPYHNQPLARCSSRRVNPYPHPSHHHPYQTLTRRPTRRVNPHPSPYPHTYPYNSQRAAPPGAAALRDMRRLWQHDDDRRQDGGGRGGRGTARWLHPLGGTHAGGSSRCCPVTDPFSLF